ncbi:Uncharacterized protein dnm_081790 [Desulfonema magnum]|uniref:Uncharacterized protein n=1 Tax=Desulfonema magnum TaxID=45655 RepID=A0A975BUQ7_9BACT|nr:Uncharacterized protein dnm_081790 [Desulfonema magnum]
MRRGRPPNVMRGYRLTAVRIQWLISSSESHEEARKKRSIGS